MQLFNKPHIKKLLTLSVLIYCINSNLYAQNQPIRPQTNPLGLPQSVVPLAIPPSMPNSGLGQQVNVQPPKPKLAIKKRVKKVFQEFEDAQLDEGQIKRLKSLNIKNATAGMTPYNNIPKPVTRTLMIDLSPGISTPVLRLSAGQLTSLVFSSLQGDPWFIDSVKLNRNIFSDGMQQGSDNTPTNVLTIEPLRALAYGNVTIMLKGLSTPVIFSLTTNQKEVDFRVDLKIPGRNPDSVSRINYADKIPNLDDNIPYFLDGIPPKEAKKLRTTDRILEAWEYTGHMYIRTSADVQYPAYYSSARSTSGVAVYRFNQVYSSITLLQNAKAHTISIEQY